MKRYFRIANDEYSYDGEYSSIEEAKNWLNANNLSNDLITDMALQCCHNWRIEDFQHTFYGGEIYSQTPFEVEVLDNGINILFSFKFQETIIYKK